MVKTVTRKPAPRTAPRASRPAPKAEAQEPPRGGFYNPEGAQPAIAQTQLSAAPAPAAPAPDYDLGEPEDFNGMHARDAVEVEQNLSADAALVDDDYGPAPDIEDREAYRRYIERIKAGRRPLGEYNFKLALPHRRGYKRHWFVDAPGRVDLATQNGWSLIRGKDGKPLRRSAGRGPQAPSQFAFAMEIPLVFWEEDQAYKHKIASDRVDGIRNRTATAKEGQAKPEDNQKFYNPQPEHDAVNISKMNPSSPVVNI